MKRNIQKKQWHTFKFIFIKKVNWFRYEVQKGK